MSCYMVKIAYNMIYSRIHERILQISMIRFIDLIKAGCEFKTGKAKRDDSDVSHFRVKIRINIQ